jgi:hypothetical protein
MGSAYYKQVTQFGPTPQSPEDDFGVSTHLKRRESSRLLDKEALTVCFAFAVLGLNIQHCWQHRQTGCPQSKQAGVAVFVHVYLHMRCTRLYGSVLYYPCAPIQLVFVQHAMTIP